MPREPIQRQLSTCGSCVTAHRWNTLYPGLVHGVSTRQALPEPEKMDFFEMIRQARGRGVLPAAWTLGGDQTHEDHVALIGGPISEDNRPEGFRWDEELTAGEFPATDALVATFPGVLLAIQTADCLPVFFVAPKSRMVGLAHCGWRGLRAGLAAKTARAMLAEGADPTVLEVWLGPCIRAAAYEVGAELVKEFAGAFPGAAVSHNGTHLDLAAVARHQLAEAGVRPDLIFDSAECTFAQGDRYHSYRRDAAGAGRMVSFIGFDIQHP
jgi:YfiH family protein